MSPNEPIKLEIKDEDLIQSVYAQETEQPKQTPYRKAIRIASVAVFSVFLILGGYIGFININWDTQPNYVDGAPQEEDVYSAVDIRAPFKFESLITEGDLEAINAEVILAYNPTTSQVFFEKGINEQKPIASITKLMSTLIILDTYDLEQELIVPEITHELEHVIGFQAGDRVKVAGLLNSMLVASYNDSAYVLAYMYPDGGYNGFITEMNARAQLLEMDNTSFENPAGLDHESNYSTAHDLKKLVYLALQREEILESVKKTEYTLEYVSVEEGVVNERMFSTNSLYGVVPNVRGLKTGYTTDAGLCFVGLFGQGEETVVTIVLNAEDRFLETEQLLRLVQSSYSSLE